MAQTHKSRSQRRKAGVRRTVKSRPMEPLYRRSTESDQVSTDEAAGDGSFYVERTDIYTAKSPIPQTRSIDLIPISIRLWVQNWWVCFLLMVLPGLVIAIGTVIIGTLDLQKINQQTLIGGLLVAIGFVWSALNLPASYYFQAALVRGEQPNLAISYRQGYRHFWRLFGLLLVTGTMALGGFLLLVVPAIIVIRRYILAPFYLFGTSIQDESKPVTIREAMVRSAADSKASSKAIWGALLTFTVLNIAIYALIGTALKPYGPFLSNLIASLFIFLLVLRYKEVGLRQSAKDLYQDNADD